MKSGLRFRTSCGNYMFHVSGAYSVSDVEMDIENISTPVAA
jgi:hypothetical protein